MRSRPHSYRDDTGAMLVIALVIITTVALVTGAMLAHGFTNFRTTVALRGVAGASYASDAAAKVALNNLRLGATAPGWTTPSFPGAWSNWVYTNNADGTGCFGATGEVPDNTLELNGAFYPKTGTQAGATSARVECTPVPGTGVFGGGAGVGINDPDPTDAYARALTTIGTSGARQGITVNPLGTGGAAPLPVRGGVASKSFVTVESGSLVTDGYVKAEGSCTGDIVAGVDDNGVEQRFCNATGSVPVPTTPPAPLSSVPTYRNASSYAGSCEFQPGFYNNAAVLSSVVNGCGTAHFNNGDYYFDFVDEEHGLQNVWNIATTVVGGDLTSDTTIPGRCATPIGRNSGGGVRFVFGGTSRIQVQDTAHVELCGPTNGGDPPMVLYQQGTGSTASSSTLTDVAAATVTNMVGSKVDNLAPSAGSLRDSVAAAGGATASVTISKNNNDAGLDLSSFPGLAAIPAGSDITSAQVRVKYAKSSAQPLSVTIKDQTPTANLPAPAIVAPDDTGWASVDVAAQLRTSLQSGSFGTSKPTVQLRLLNGTRNDTVKVDAVTLSLSYVPPTLRAATDVDFISDFGGNFHGEFVVQGATWAPHGFVHLVPGSFDSALVAFRWGLVALGVDFKAQPSQQFGYPLVSIPDAGTGLGSRVTVVDLKVFVCVAAATCNAGGTHALTVRAMITDPPYNTSGTFDGIPEPGRRRIEVLSWAEQH